MGKTVKRLIKQLSKLQQRIRIWDEVQSFLERSQSIGGQEPINKIMMEDGSEVDNEVILNMLSEIDDSISDTHRQIEELEKMEVGSGKVARKKSRSAAGGKRKSPASGSRARPSVGKDDTKSRKPSGPRKRSDGGDSV
jgi:hypothetical protein